MKTINRMQLQEKLDRNGVALVDVLSREAYKEFHLPHAFNVPLGEDFETAIQRVVRDKNQPVVVYCHDVQCNASSNAAKKLDELGYSNVFDYEGGKVDWKEAGLPVESGESV